MGVALRDLQIGPQAGQIQGGGGLAHAAADLVHGFALDVSGSSLIALGSSPLAHGAVVGEHLTAVEHHAVEGGGGELDVVDPGGSAGDVGAASLKPDFHSPS